MIQEAIEIVVSGRNLSTDQASDAMEQIMTGEATPAQFGALVTALRMKGETVDEIVGMARVMREKSLHVEVEGVVVDTAGTGRRQLRQLQHLDDCCTRRCRSRRQGRQARQPRDVGLHRVCRRA